jgi:O-antigen/teichoic acid export membrane protein
MLLVLGLSLVAMTTGLIARHKNRNVLGWSLAGAAFFIIALLLLIGLPPLPKASLGDKLRRTRSATWHPPLTLPD